ncbi:radical SAM protein [Geoglobus acetivorans]|uniref:Radical SAM domain protein n=1 Tax=Geoglobus acetivorans TaxID=565033 RepID=A0A0A7GBW6_GEOAI|nr:radical SAM domain protein [Geoglobus acetivorans]
MKFRRIEAGSYYSYLSEGCRLCRKGAKMVLFITGSCPHNCFYCPISEDRRGKDVVFANERFVENLDDIVDEALSMSAEGVAITGGEPLTNPERVYEFLEIFSHAGLHTHIYTSIPVRESMISKLSEKGLDEIRFHPPELENAEMYEAPLKAAKKSGIEAGFEVPALRFDEVVVKIVNGNDAFLNVNELEFSDSNYRRLMESGWEPGDFYQAIGSKEVADEYARKVDKFHFCSVKFKEIAQFRRRLIRMAFNMPDFYRVTKEGTVICGLVEGNKDEIRKFLIRMNAQFTEVDEGFEVDVGVAEKLKDRFYASIIERYPTAERLILEKDPLR